MSDEPGGPAPDDPETEDEHTADPDVPAQTEVDDQPLGKPPPEDPDDTTLPGFPGREPPSGG